MQFFILSSCFLGEIFDFFLDFFDVWKDLRLAPSKFVYSSSSSSLYICCFLRVFYYFYVLKIGGPDPGVVCYPRGTEI